MADATEALPASLIEDNQRLEQLIIQRRILEQAEENRAVAMAIEAEQTMTEAWGDLVDPLEYLRDEPGYSPLRGRTASATVSQSDDRLNGRNRPVFETEWELMAITGAARMLHAAFPTAKTALSNLASFVLGDGFVTKTSERQGCPDGLADAVQSVIDEFYRLNNWQGDNGKEEELFTRSHRDGEAICALEPTDGGRTRLKFVEPSHLTEPDQTRELEDWLGCGEPSSWSFGVHSREGDSENVFGYYVQQTPNPGDFTYYPVDCVVHVKQNVDSGVKRGLSDFYPVQSHLMNIGKLERNVALGAAVLSAIIGIRQHPPGTTKSQAQDLISSLAYRRRTVSQPAGSKTMHTFKAEPGSLLDIPNGMEYKSSPLANQGVGQAFVTIEQALLRTVGTNWNMPEYMISGDASNANYSSTLIAESPFVKFCKRKQRNHRANNLDVLWKMLRIACEAGRFRPWGVQGAEELQLLVVIILQAPIVEARDRPAETNRRKILHDDGVISKQTWAEEEGYDHVEEVKRGAERQQAGPGMSGMQEAVMEGRTYKRNRSGEFSGTGTGGGAKSLMQRKADEANKARQVKSDVKKKPTKPATKKPTKPATTQTAAKQSATLAIKKPSATSSPTTPASSNGFSDRKAVRQLAPGADVSPGLRKGTAKMSAGGKATVEKYTSGATDYRAMNESLRAGKMTPDAKALNGAIGEAGDLPKGTTVYRGLSVSSEEQAAMVAQFRGAAQSGGEITMSGISSTSLDPQVAANFADRGQGSIVFEMKPKSGAYVSELSGFDRTARAGKGLPENEVLLQHGKKYKVAAVQDDVSLGKKKTKGWGMTVVQLEEI